MPPSLGTGVDQPSQQSTHGRSPQREAHRRRVSSQRQHWEVSKRLRSPFLHLDDSYKWWPRRETERAHRHWHGPSPSSGSSQEGSFDGQIARRAERRMKEYNQQLEELSHRITNQPEVDYDSRPPLSRCIMKEPISNRFCLPQLDPYNSTMDPLDHLESYKVLMQV